MYVIRKASDENYVGFDNKETFDAIEFCQKHGSFIFRLNWNYNNNPEKIAEFWEISLDKAKKVANSKYEIIIYDDYVE